VQTTGHAHHDGRLCRHGILAFGIITLLTGIAVLVWPGRTLVLVLAVLLSAWLLIFGAMEIALAFRIRPLGR
jgi:uncharacterized membrane protein HdeD (DUF308 family)